jgi:SAM-dependent methyltransferase
MRRWLAAGYTKINVGGGEKNLEGYLNIDFVPHGGVTRELVANILDLSFIPDHSLTQVHSNHVLEHLSWEQLGNHLSDCRRILRPGGILSLRCPNALGVSYAFFFEPILETDREVFIEIGFPSDETFGSLDDTWGHKDVHGFLHWIYGDLGNPENQHLVRLTPTVIAGLLAYHGFALKKLSVPEAINIVAVASIP